MPIPVLPDGDRTPRPSSFVWGHPFLLVGVGLLAGMLIMFGIQANMRQQREAAPDSAAHPRRDTELARLDALIDEIYIAHRGLADRAGALFPDDPREIASNAYGACEGLKEYGIAADVDAVLEGGIYLREHTRDPHESPSFGSYTYLYAIWRRDGLTHEQVISKMHELRKL